MMAMPKGYDANAKATLVAHITIQCEGCDELFVVDDTLDFYDSTNCSVVPYGIAVAHSEGVVRQKATEAPQAVAAMLQQLHDRYRQDTSLPELHVVPAMTYAGTQQEKNWGVWLPSIPKQPCPKCGYYQSYMAGKMAAPVAPGCLTGIVVLGAFPMCFFVLTLLSTDPTGQFDGGINVDPQWLAAFALYVALWALGIRWARRKVKAEKERPHPNAVWLAERDLTLAMAPPYRPPADWKCDPKMEVTTWRD